MTKITYDKLEEMLFNPDVPDSAIRPYLIATHKPGQAFDLEVLPNPEQVEMTQTDRLRVESAMRWGNAIARWRRQQRYKARLANGDTRPVLVSEGDSWFQFPFLIDDVIDHLSDDHLIWSLDAAGDTAQNMVFNNGGEYLKGLRACKNDRVRAFLFSAAGNDVIGEDESGKPVLEKLLKPYQQGQDAAWHVDKAALSSVLQFLEGAYRQVIQAVRAEPGFATLPIILHGYDYVIPHGGVPGDGRSPSYAKKNEWLGIPLDARGITDRTLRQNIIRFLIDALYDMLHRLAGDSNATRVYVVDVRGTLPNVSDWNDEIHGTSSGFRLVADRFRATLQQAGIP